MLAKCPLHFVVPFSRSSFKSACSLSLLADQQPENFCSTQHCSKCPHSNSLLPTALWDTNVSPLGLLRNFLPVWKLVPITARCPSSFTSRTFVPSLTLIYLSLTSHPIMPSRHDPRERTGGDHQKHGYQCCTG